MELTKNYCNKMSRARGTSAPLAARWFGKWGHPFIFLSPTHIYCTNWARRPECRGCRRAPTLIIAVSRCDCAFFYYFPTNVIISYQAAVVSPLLCCHQSPEAPWFSFQWILMARKFKFLTKHCMLCNPVSASRRVYERCVMSCFV